MTSIRYTKQFPTRFHKLVELEFHNEKHTWVDVKIFTKESRILLYKERCHKFQVNHYRDDIPSIFSYVELTATKGIIIIKGRCQVRVIALNNTQEQIILEKIGFKMAKYVYHEGVMEVG